VSDGVMFFDGWRPILRTVVVGVLSYGVLVAMLRATGKRTLSKLNAFDLVVTVALGSTMATVLTSGEVALAQGAVAFAVLIGLQFAITWSSVRWRPVRRLVKSEPRMLVHRGELLRDAMRHERVTEDELRAAMRASGVDDLARVELLVLETDGSLSVVRGHGSGGSGPA
jgi:uncharacterized membrane protein YcaP (DUF421 family)